MSKNSIIFTSTAEYLVKNLKKKLKNFEFFAPEKNKDKKRYFPEGEVYMRLSKISALRKAKKVVVLHSGAPDPNTGLVELEFILQTLKDYKIRPEVFFTYFPYCRQDKVFEKGETSVAENIVKKLTNYYQVLKIYIIDPHFGKMDWLKKYPIKSVSALPLLIKRAKKNFGEAILFLSPDKGGKRRTGIPGLNKKRINSFDVKPFSSEMPSRGKIVGVVDDIIATGGTLLRFYEFVKKSGVKLVIALITHGVLDGGVKKVKKSFTKLYLANTINRKEANVDITDLIASTII
ncbi:MAG: ribose-phosphate diphosphokinase [Patescibacteria group bacterium]